MKAIAIITARGGSKRIPEKNIKPFCGRPILCYSVEAALASGVFSEVMVSTDSEKIAEIARECGAAVPFLRSSSTANDYATTAEVLREVLNEYEKRGRIFDALCCIYPTAPFVTAQKLRDAMLLLDDTADSVVTAVQYSFPPQRAFVVREGYAAYQYPAYSKTRSQDLEPIYHDCGQFYICRTDEFLRAGTLITPRTKPFLLPETEVQDIDTLSDWAIAEMKYNLMRKEMQNVSHA